MVLSDNLGLMMLAKVMTFLGIGIRLEFATPLWHRKRDKPDYCIYVSCSDTWFLNAIDAGSNTLASVPRCVKG